MFLVGGLASLLSRASVAGEMASGAISPFFRQGIAPWFLSLSPEWQVIIGLAAFFIAMQIGPRMARRMRIPSAQGFAGALIAFLLLSQFPFLSSMKGLAGLATAIVFMGLLRFLYKKSDAFTVCTGSLKT